MSKVALPSLTFSSVERKPLLDGVCITVTFENGYGASIINHRGSYGVELAVLNSRGILDYSTPITNNVLGWLTPETLSEALIAIRNLPVSQSA